MINQKHIDYLSKVDNTLKNIIKTNTIPKISKSNDYILDLYKYIIFQQIWKEPGAFYHNPATIRPFAKTIHFHSNSILSPLYHAQM